MVSILLASLLAGTAAAANITTSIWLPGVNLENSTILASVIERSGDNTIMSVTFTAPPKNTELPVTPPPRVTVAGTTRVVLTEVVSDDGASGSAPPVTVGLDCTRPSGGPSAVPTCTYSTIGADFALSAVCSGLTAASLPAYCTGSKQSAFAETYTLSGESQYYLNNYPLIITAGTEKIDATAAGTPRSSGATPTGGSPVGSLGSPSQATGAAAPMKSLVPALAGLGAAAAIFF